MKLFKDTLGRTLLIPMIRDGEPRVKECTDFCESVLRRLMTLDDDGDLDDNYAEALSELFCIFKVVLSFLKGDFVDGTGQEHLDVFGASLQQRSSRSLVCLVAVVMEQTPAYVDMQSNFSKFAAPTRELKPRIESAIEELAKSKALGKATAGNLLSAYRIFKEVDGKVRPSALMELSALLKSETSGVVQALLKEISDGTTLTDDPEQVSEMLTLATEMLGHDDDRQILAGKSGRCTL